VSDAPRIVTDDGLYTPEIKLHSLEKIRLHNCYAGMFAAGMRKKWPQLAYIGLYSGPGHARVAKTGEVIETSALAVLRQHVGFTDYVFVDNAAECVQALRARVSNLGLGTERRVTILHGDVNESAAEVRRALPDFSHNRGLLSFCFIDPFDLQLRFETIRSLSDLRIDFLILLMLGVDARRNFARYINDASSTRIGDLIACPQWRSEFQAGHNVVHFLFRKFDEAMKRIGYLSAANDTHAVTIAGMGVFQYVLAFYSKSEVGQHFWRASRASLSQQLTLGLFDP
jgi:three-Cys-motif partner protein